MIRSVALFGLLTLLSATVAFGQVVTGSISGRVTDSSGAAIPGATIAIQNAETGLSRNERADREGRYLSRDLPLGSYILTVQEAGFKTEVRRGVTLSVGSEVSVNFELAVGGVQERVEVTAEAPAIETTNATLSGLVTPADMRDLPLNGRNLEQLQLLVPGAIANKNQSNNLNMGYGMRLSVDGGRANANSFLIDGTIANDHAANGPNSANGASLGVEGILEFRVLSHNFSAEYGQTSGAVISQVTRSGTNDLHGSVYEFLRNNVFDARNFFNVGALPPFRRNQFGGAVGGRIIKDKLFLFANYEGLRQAQQNPVISTVPDANARQGLVPVSGVLTKVPLNPAVVPYLNIIPLPNGPNFGDGTGEWIFNFPSTGTENYGMTRVDYRISDKDSLYARYIIDQSESISPLAMPLWEADTTGKNQFLVLSETHIFSGTSLNEFRSAINRTDPESGETATIPIDPALSFIPGQPLGEITFSFTPVAGQISGGLTGLGIKHDPPGPDRQRNIQNLFQDSDTFSTVRGAHALKFGVNFVRQQLNAGGANYVGKYQFGGLIPLLAGQAQNFSGGPPIANAVVGRGFRRDSFAWFVQDDIRVSSRLTLNLGLRQEFWTSPTEVGNRMGNLINLTDSASTPGASFQTRKDNFSPRVGLAWDPTGRGKMSVRAGVGVFYNFISGRTWFINVQDNPVPVSCGTITNPPFPFGYAGCNPQTGLPGLSGMTYQPDEPTVLHYSLEVQRALTRSLSLRVGYVGAYGYHMAYLEQPDTRIPQVQPDGTLLFPAKGPLINPNFAATGGTYVNFGAHYSYNGLQTVLQKTLSAGLIFQATYTYSKTMSDGDQVTFTEATNSPASLLQAGNLARDYSLSAYDQRHTLVLTSAYKMPWDKALKGGLSKGLLGGWSVNGIFSYGSGLPLDIETGFNRSQDGVNQPQDRPDLAPGFSNNPIHGTSAGCQGVPAGTPVGNANHWYDPCAFVLQTAGTYGNLGRNTVTGPGLKDVDFTLLKTTSLTESKRLEFRAEFFNIFNHANLGLPGETIFDSTGARTGNDGTIITTAVDNREIQLGLKLIF